MARQSPSRSSRMTLPAEARAAMAAACPGNGRAAPKSVSLAWPDAVSRMFSGLRSPKAKPRLRGGGKGVGGGVECGVACVRVGATGERVDEWHAWMARAARCAVRPRCAI